MIQKLHAAIGHKDVEEVAEILATGVDANGQYGYRTPLMTLVDIFACRNHHSEPCDNDPRFDAILDLLLTNGAEIDKPCVHLTALMIASYSGNPHIIRSLIQHGANPFLLIPSGDEDMNHSALSVGVEEDDIFDEEWMPFLLKTYPLDMILRHLLNEAKFDPFTLTVRLLDQFEHIPNRDLSWLPETYSRDVEMHYFYQNMLFEKAREKGEDVVRELTEIACALDRLKEAE